MTALYRGICYPEADAAKQAACSAASTIWGDKDAVYSVECASQIFGGSDMTLCKRVNGGACQMFTQPYPTFPYPTIHAAPLGCAMVLSGSSSFHIRFLHKALDESIRRE